MSSIIVIVFFTLICGGGTIGIQDSQVNPVALGLYATPEVEQPIKLENQGDVSTSV
jgi:hypothetical protein